MEQKIGPIDPESKHWLDTYQSAINAAKERGDTGLADGLMKESAKIAKWVIPDGCTSATCGDFGCDYCRECSHAQFRGRSKVDEKMYRWLFEPYYGVTFLTKTGDPLTTDEIPGENHPVWERFGKWQKRRGLR